jgi:hypothetical protein
MRASTIFNASYVLILPIMDGFCQLEEITKPDGISSILKTPDGTLGHSRLAREKFCGKLFCLSPDFFEISRVNTSFVFPESLVRWVQFCGFTHHRQIGTTRPTGRGLFADVVKLTRHDMPVH